MKTSSLDFFIEAAKLVFFVNEMSFDQIDNFFKSCVLKLMALLDHFLNATLRRSMADSIYCSYHLMKQESQSKLVQGL